MRPRRSSSTSLLPSSPPPAPQHPGEPNSPPSPARTLWTAHSPTLTLGHSSPELPTLSSLSALGTLPRTPSTAARNDPTDTSYYTASWGSPYRHPPPVFNPDRHASAAFDSDDLDEASSALQFGLGHLIPTRPELQDDSPNRFNLEHLIPRLEQNGSPNQFTLEHLIQSRLPILDTPARQASPSGRTPKASDSNPTSEEWVRQFLEERWNREANNWRSDVSFDIDSDRESAPDEDIRILGIPKRGHKPRNNNKTLNQQDFWRHISKDQKEALGKMMASKYAESDVTSHPRQTTEATSSTLPTGSGRDITPSPSPRLREQNTNMLAASIQPPPTPTPRTRKKIMVKGKGCVISIPHDIPRGTHGYPPKPMSAEAVAAKLQNLERQGYSTRGFGHWNGIDAEQQQPHNRAIWPGEADVQAERANIGSRFPVYVPKKVEWDNYVNSLVEAKLAALGVSLGGDDEAPPSMSRQASSQQYPGLPFSPPLPSTSANGHRIRQGSLASVGSFPFGPSPGHMSRQSVASPAAFANARPSMHMHRHSTFASPANFAHHTMSPSGTWSPGNYFGSQDGRGASPALPLSRPDLNSLVSPNSHSPFGRRGSQQFPHSPLQPDDLMVQMQIQQQQMQQQQMQQQQQQLQTQLYQQQQQQLLGMRPSSTLAEVPEDEAEEEAPPVMKHATKPAPEIVIPTPRGHHHNISETLEREAADAEYHLEEAIDKQFAAGGDFSTEPELTGQRKNANHGANPTWENSRTILHQPQPHNRTHSLTQSQQPVSFAFPSQQSHNPHGDSDGALSNVSENTNPSLEEGEIRNPTQNATQHAQAPSQVSNPWKDSKFAFGKPGSAAHSKHASRSSISKLNVEAKEFKFNPAASFNPESFTPAIKPPTETAPRSEKLSIDSMSGFNVTAPVFKPDVPAFKPAESNPAIANGSTFPKSDFDFSSPPSFKPEAPVFNPVVSPFTPEKSVPAPTSFTSKIFGDVNISASDIVKPATRSKAVPIVRPDTAREKTPEEETEKEDPEDEEGRPMQADGREKRVRRGRTDADDVPKFALQPVLASQPLVEAPLYLNTKPGVHNAQSEDKENLLPNGTRAQQRGRSQGRTTPVPAPVPDPVKSSPHKIQLEPIDPDQTVLHLSDAHTASTEEYIPSAKKHAHKTSSLSASAKPFEFRPQQGSVGYDFGFHVTKPSTNEEFEKTRISPSRYASRSPATTFRPSDDGSFKTALESGRRGRYMTESESIDFDPSFNDIDAVMKHMNEEGSDFGVERDDNSWDQSSPQRTPHGFDRFDLRPNVTLRSDAPSPSPRRLYAQRSGQASASGQDPFDDERAGLAYDSAVHRLNHAGDVPMSDWDDEGLITEGDDKIQMRSQFFDKRIDEVMGRSLQSRLGPLEQNLRGIQDALAMMSQRPGRGRRSMSTTRLDSDADDEDDDVGADSHHRNRSPRKDKRLEKMRSIIREALESHQAQATSAPAYDSLREIIADVLVAHQPQSAARVEPVPVEQIRAIVEEAIASTKPHAQEPASAPVNPEDIRAILAETLALHAPKPAESVKSDDIRAIVMEAIATQPVPTLQEQIRPEDIKAILTEAFASQQQQAPPVQPETLRSIVVDALSSHQPPAPIPSIVEPMQPETIRSIVSEALASHKPSGLEAPIDIPQPQFDISEIYQMIGSLKASIAQTTSHHLQAEDVRELVDDAFKRQSMEVAKKEESEAILERDARIAEMQALLDDQSLRLESEVAARKALEACETDTSHLLKVTEEELSLLQKAASDDESRIRVLTEERDSARHSLDTYQSSSEELRHKLAVIEAENEDIKLKNIALESSEEDLKKKLDVVNSENEALTFTLEEHRLSANKWRNDIQEAHQDNEKLRRANEQARYQAEEAARVRESMRGKFEKLQQDMVLAAQQVAAERAQWQQVDEDSLKKYEVLSARIEAEGRTRERLERELERLETQEREGMKLRIHFEQAQKQISRLEEIIDQLRQESSQHQKNAERYERDMREAREAAHVEIRRTRVLLEADIEAANNQVNIVRHNLESEVARARAELDNVRMDADTAKEKHELDLEAASDATKQAVQEAHASNKSALLEQQLAFERALDHVREEQARAAQFAQEDRERSESFHNDKLALADSKLDHFKDKIALLEEKLVIAKEAASAAAAAASKSGTTTSAISATGPEKISPQALRESISVLQEQLQEREARIESLEQQLTEVDNDAPAKLKERDTEITWLRELLGVRVDDLNDLINALAQPTFDRENVRDAAIRIRTNLQMEQQEKERLITGGQQSFPTLATLSNFASPKAVQFAAAFGNWRKGRGENASSALAGASSNASASRNQTPSRPGSHSAQSFLSGLMTPPTSNLRRTPDLSSSKLKDVRSNSTSSHGSTEAGFPALGKQAAAPRTPPLMRKTSYDRDAEVEQFSDNGFYDDDSTVDGGDVTPIALNFGQELRRESSRQ